MARSFHVTEVQRRRDHYFNRDNQGIESTTFSKLDVLSLKKLCAKWTEKWRRDAAKVGGLGHIEFCFDERDPSKKVFRQKCRGRLSDVPGEVIESGAS